MLWERSAPNLGLGFTYGCQILGLCFVLQILMLPSLYGFWASSIGLMELMLHLGDNYGWRYHPRVFSYYNLLFFFFKKSLACI